MSTHPCPRCPRGMETLVRDGRGRRRLCAQCRAVERLKQSERRRARGVVPRVAVARARRLEWWRAGRCVECGEAREEKCFRRCQACRHKRAMEQLARRTRGRDEQAVGPRREIVSEGSGDE